MALQSSLPLGQKIVSPKILSPVLDWIDRELVDTYSATQGYGGNCLLELRQVFQQTNLNVFVSKFYRLLPRLESTHYLLSYRIRHWVALHFDIVASDPLERVSSQTFSFDPNQAELPALRHHFFEHAAKVIPLSDIRIQVRQKA